VASSRLAAGSHAKVKGALPLTVVVISDEFPLQITGALAETMGG
jgi:hypothetical protein